MWPQLKRLLVGPTPSPLLTVRASETEQAPKACLCGCHARFLVHEGMSGGVAGMGSAQPALSTLQAAERGHKDLAWGARVQQLLQLLALVALGAWWMAEDASQLVTGQCR